MLLPRILAIDPGIDELDAGRTAHSRTRTGQGVAYGSAIPSARIGASKRRD